MVLFQRMILLTTKNYPKILKKEYFVCIKNLGAVMNLAKLGARIKSQREKRRLTQAQIANSLHISAQAISKWERGENAPDISTLKPLSTLLGRNIEWILTGSDENDNIFGATILCSSMRNFAKRATANSPETVALYINGLFHTITEAVLAENGVPIKYVGDGFLAYFSGEEHAERALKASQTILKAINELDLLLTLNSGEIYLGAIGHHEYAQPDIMGESVNFTFMMNRWATDESKARLLISESTLSDVKKNDLKLKKCSEKISDISIFEIVE
jgi:class 3 adenylate cyclase